MAASRSVTVGAVAQGDAIGHGLLEIQAAKCLGLEYSSPYRSISSTQGSERRDPSRRVTNNPLGDIHPSGLLRVGVSPGSVREKAFQAGRADADPSWGSRSRGRRVIGQDSRWVQGILR